MKILAAIGATAYVAYKVGAEVGFSEAMDVLERLGVRIVNADDFLTDQRTAAQEGWQ